MAGIRPPFAAVIFDLDGVVTNTAVLHAEAWKRLFDGVLRDPRISPPGAQRPFDPVKDYRRHLDGRSRVDGVRAFLASRHVTLPEGTGTDDPSDLSVSGLAARKDKVFHELLSEQGVRVFPGTEALLRRLRDGGVPTGLVTASRNAGALLAAAGIGGWFDVVVDGTTAQQLHLTGKPDPMMFCEAATRLGVEPVNATVVEDAVAGIQAARRGGFGLVVGIARHDNRAELEQAGADLVVEDVSQLDLGVLRGDAWMLSFQGFDPAHEGHREALTTLANGYLGTRGATPESAADGVHYPGTYLAGVYSRLTNIVEGARSEDEQIVNVPNWLFLDLRVADGEWWSAGGLSCENERTDLDLRRGVLVRRLRLVDEAGRGLRVVQRRLVSMARAHVAALATSIQAEGWEGKVTVRSGIDASVTNHGVPEFEALARQHLRHVRAEQVDATQLLVEAETTSSRIGIASAIRTTIDGNAALRPRQVQPAPGCHALEMTLEVSEGARVVIEKTAAFVTSKDPAIASPKLGAVAEIRRAPRRFDELLSEHETAWQRLWERYAIEVKGLEVQDALVLNLHLFHLMQTFTRHTTQLDAGVPARGLHGEGYRGHVFWDELFVLPMLATQEPAAARAVLEYRWRRLPAAREAARDLGSDGALFPWQSGSDGREETPSCFYNPRSKRWVTDSSWRQRHVGLAVAYNAWHFYATTADLTWLAERGAELIIEVTRLFASIARHDANTGRFHIEEVMGPDEYHDGSPDAPGTGLRDNAYTNVMVAWVCGRALEVLRLLRGQACDELASALNVTPDEPTRWVELQQGLAVPFHEGVISQFDGYQDLLELDWPRYRTAYGNIGRLDLILEAEGDTTNRYKLSKQADVLMLVYLLGVEDLLATLATLGYRITRDDVVRTVNYYLARTAHGSTLSRVVHASVLAQIDPGRAWTLFREALVADLDDTQGGTTREGVHLGAMAGTIDMVRKAFAGLRMDEREMTFEPRLPAGVKGVRFRVHYQGHHVAVNVEPDGIRLHGHDCKTPRPLWVKVAGASAVLEPGATRSFASLGGTEA